MKKGDKILSFIFFIVMLGSVFAYYYLNQFEPNNKRVVVKVEGKEKLILDLNGQTEGLYDFEFNQQIGQVLIKNESVRMIEMDQNICPRGICSDTGWISKSYEMIVCLPNRITVEIESNDEVYIDDMVF
jgi:hypothetical protein